MEGHSDVYLLPMVKNDQIAQAVLPTTGYNALPQ